MEESNQALVDGSSDPQFVTHKSLAWINDCINEINRNPRLKKKMMLLNKYDHEMQQQDIVIAHANMERILNKIVYSILGSDFTEIVESMLHKHHAITSEQKKQPKYMVNAFRLMALNAMPNVFKYVFDHDTYMSSVFGNVSYVIGWRTNIIEERFFA